MGVISKFLLTLLSVMWMTPKAKDFVCNPFLNPAMMAVVNIMTDRLRAIETMVNPNDHSCK